MSDWGIFEKNVELWEKWTSTYMDTMSKAMDKTLEQSASFRKQVDQAVAASIGAQMDAALAGIQALERQIEMLSEKMDELLKEQE